VLRRGWKVSSRSWLLLTHSTGKGKAIRRAQAALPISPRKRKVVIKPLAKNVVLKHRIITTRPVFTLNCGGLNRETEELDLTFYNKNNILLWQAPGQ